ncbi:T6SS phospholipase effector Tle1-like catalytic domain-containing protein [Pseudomonas sp. S2_C03]
MSAVNHVSVWYPSPYPVQGRLPRREGQVRQNLRRQAEWEVGHHDALSVAAGHRVLPPCCKTLHISLCFDGTGNNLNNDLYLSTPPNPTNIARMFRASIGTGHAGGTGHASSKARGLIDFTSAGNNQYFKYYMPGVGTPFAEVGDLDYTQLGMATGWYGEERINWALLMIIDALRRSLDLPRMDNAALLGSVKAMGTLVGMESGGETNRANVFDKQLAALEQPLRTALEDNLPARPKLLGIKLYVYGFSRGAAAARAFVNWLNQLLDSSATTPSLNFKDLTLPVSVEYLGLLDTVASVGLADIAFGADGHMGWADSSQEIPDRLVKRCLHLVASHEQRLCFPSESIRRASGGYPVNSMEVIYPGVHSDVGGGYPPGDQGKALSSVSWEGDGLLLSQIALNDLYADAFAHGAPLKVPKHSLPVGLSTEHWRAMEDDLVKAFGVSPVLAERFNAWREITLNLLPVRQPLSPEQTDYYEPLSASTILEEAMRNQLGWITAWRIDRYGFSSLRQTAFYQQASDTQVDPYVQQKAEAAREAKQNAIKNIRKEQLINERVPGTEKKPMEPGVKDFDADMAQTQLREAAQEFSLDYRNIDNIETIVLWLAALTLLPAIMLNQMTVKVRAERAAIKALGMKRVSQLFPPPKFERNHVDEKTRHNVDESRNAQEATGLLRALFDDQVHDSRAWFLYAKGRERGGTYFSERMVFFGEANRRELVLLKEVNGVMVADSRHSQPRPTPTSIFDAETLADMQRRLSARWETFEAQAKEARDGVV